MVGSEGVVDCWAFLPLFRFPMAWSWSTVGVSGADESVRALKCKSYLIALADQPLSLSVACARMIQLQTLALTRDHYLAL